MGVGHQVGGPVVVGDVGLAQTAVLVDTLHVTARSDIGVAVVVVAVDTHAVGNVQPAGEVEVGGHGAGDTFVLVGQNVPVDDPVRVLDLFGLVDVGEHAVFRTVVVEPVRHVLAARPHVEGRHRTVAAAVIQAGGGEGLLGVGDGVGHVGAHGQDAVFLLAVEADGVLHIGGTGDDTTLGEVRGGEEERAVLVAAGDADAVVEHVAALEEVADVVIAAALEFLTPGAHDLVGLEHAVGVVRTTGVGVLDLRGTADGRIGILAREVDLHVAVGSALLGGDHHDAVGCAGTVQGGCGSTLQHGHGLDILGVDIHHAVGEGGGRLGHTVGTGVTAVDGGVIVDDTVDDEERLVVAAFGSGVTTTDDDGGTGTGSTAGLRHVDARDLAGQGVDDVGLLVAEQFFRLDFRHGIAQCLALFLDTEGRHDGLLQHLRIVGHDDVDHRAAGDSHFLVLVADAGKLEGTVGRHVDPVRAVGIGRCTDGCTYNHHVGTNDRLVVLVDYLTGNGNVLSQHRSR